jgi:hypothetical protein
MRKIIIFIPLTLFLLVLISVYSQEPPPPTTQGKIQPRELNSKASTSSNIKAKDSHNKSQNSMSPINKTDTQIEDNATQNSGKPANNSQLGAVKDDSITRYTYWLMVFTGLLFVCNVFLWLYTKKAADAAQKAADALPTIERAYVSVLVTIPVINSLNYMGGTFNANLIVRNDGKTPAIITKVCACMEIRKTIPADFSKIKKIEIIDTSIPSGKRLINDIHVSSGINIENNKIIVLGGQHILYCYGRIDYEDIFNVPQYILFCWQYSHIFRGGIRTQNKELNYRT